METDEQYFGCLCRTCMNKVEASSHGGTTKPQQQWLSIFDITEECGALRIAELLSDAVPQIVVQPNDELSKKICSECLQRLLNVYRFQQMCVQSDRQMHELLSTKQTVLKTPMLDEAIKGETERSDAESEPLEESSTLQQPSTQEPPSEVTVQTIEPEAAQSSAADHLQDNTHCNDSQGEFAEFVKNEPIEDDEANSEYSDGDTIHSTISVTKDEPIELEDQQINATSSQHNCHLCNKSYKTSESLKRHLLYHKKKANFSKGYYFACHLCSKSYQKQQYLSKHLNVAHSIEPLLTCDFCNERFASSSELRQHIRIHTGEQPYVCPECGKSFNTQRSLVEHRKTHSEDTREGETSHQGIKCDICGKSFTWKSRLRLHKLIHSREKPYKCSLCEKRFSRSYELPIHMCTHTGENPPYKCRYCERTFAASSCLNRHLRIHLGKNIYRCKFCPLAFPLAVEMRLHLTSHKNEDPETRQRNLKALEEEEAKLELKFSKEKSEWQHQQKLTKKKIVQRTTDSSSNATRHKKIHEGIKRHKCRFCGKQFRRKCDMIIHERTHTKEKLYKCDLCEKRFARNEQRKVHIRTHTGERPYKCKYCKRGFAAPRILNDHLRIHLGENNYRCKFCPLAFPSSAEKYLHLTSHKNEDPETRERNLKALQEEEVKLVLKFSQEKSKEESTEEQPSTDVVEEQQEQQKQRTTHTEDKPYECPYCPLRFSRKESASIHKTIHEGIKRHKCSICGKQFRQKCTLIVHKRFHSKEKPHKCDQCEKRFVQIHQLKYHIRTHTGEKPFKCNYCERGFGSPSILRSHLRSHLGKNFYICKLCPLAFPSSAERLVHLTSHKNEDPEVRERNLKALQEEEAMLKLKFSKEKSEGQSTEEQQPQKLSNKEIEQPSTDTYAGDKPYECPYCPLRFRSKTMVWQHKLVHEGAAKRHECDICGQKFRRSCDLKTHKRIHSNEKRHKCDFCEKRFIRSQQLKVHIRTHTGEKPYKCKYCARDFASLSGLTCHLHFHLGKNIHRCKCCPLAVPSYAELMVHLTSHKNEDPETRERNLKALQEEEAKLVLKFSAEKWKGQSTEEQQKQKLSNKEIEQLSTDILAEQRTTNAEDKPYERPYCLRRFNSTANSSRHKAVVHGRAAKPHQCDICEKQFRLKHDLIKHKRIHSKEKPHKCDLCEKRFTLMHHLKKHILTHTGEKPYKCKYCERGCASTTLLNHHLRSHLGENIHRCKFCPLAFPSSAEMRLHLTSHKNEDPEVRERNLNALQEEEAKLVLKFSKEKSKGLSTEEQQQQKFSNKEIEQHSKDILAVQRTTDADKPYECPYCPRRFSLKGNASKHKQIHEGATKRHECDICGKKYHQKRNLMRHKRTHGKEKCHKCDLCEKQFAEMAQLKAHIRIHTGEKPFKCKYCEREFTSRGSLTQHLHSHLGRNIHRCKFCPLAFRLAAEMRLHLTSHKKEDPEIRERNLKALQEVEVHLKLKFSKENTKGQSREEKHQQKLSNKEIEQPSTERDDFEEFIKNEPIEDDKSSREYDDGETMHSTISVTKDEALPIETADPKVNETFIHYNSNKQQKNKQRCMSNTAHVFGFIMPIIYI